MYRPSHHESQWASNVRVWGSNQTLLLEYCRHLAPYLPDIRRLTDARAKLMASIGHPHIGAAEMQLFSYLVYTYRCGRHTLHSRVPIEPLLGSLRHPLVFCGEPRRKGQYFYSKEYMLLASAYTAPHSVPQPQQRGAPQRAYIFDLGASLYTSGAGGASQKWFVDTLTDRGFEIDGYYGWEATPHSREDVMRDVPAWLQQRYHYHNLPAPYGVVEPGNPLNIIKQVATQGDYVLLKIDIDDTPLELEFIRQVMSDPQVAALVDELFFEHHVNFKPMQPDWHTANEIQQLSDSYEIFTRLRQLGIRAHSWV